MEIDCYSQNDFMSFTVLFNFKILKEIYKSSYVYYVNFSSFKFMHFSLKVKI